MTQPVLQKLLTAQAATGIVQYGLDQVTGIVAEAGASQGLRTAQDLLLAHGIDEPSATSVHVVRFPLPPGAQLLRPLEDAAPRPWPTFPTGFLKAGGLIPAWFLTRTRYPAGAELWRVDASGRQDLVMPYLGAARGWVGAPQWTPPVTLVGTRAVWQGEHYPADLEPDGSVTLTRLGTDDQPGWTRVRPSASGRTVPMSEVEQLFEFRSLATLNGQSVRVIAQDAQQAHVQFEPGNVDAVLAAGARVLDADVFEAMVPSSALRDPQLLTSTVRA